MLSNLSGFSILNPKKRRAFQEITGTFSVPEISFASATTSSVTTTLTNYDAAMTYVISSSAGTASRTNQTITVSGLSANQSTTVTATATGSKGLAFTTTSSAFLSLPATPTLSQTGQTETSVTVTITNYDAGLTYTVGSSAGSATRSGNAITVTGLTGGQTVTVTATASNSSGNSAQGSVSATSEIVGDFESIATVTVGSGGASSIEFTSIPSTFAHLQVRGISRDTRSTSANNVRFRLNGDTGSNYTTHVIFGNGSSVSSSAQVSVNNPERFGISTGATAPASTFGAAVVEILDYASTSKTTTIRSLHGYELNSPAEGAIRIGSTLWNNTSAVTSITLIPAVTGKFAQHSTYALYGIKAP